MKRMMKSLVVVATFSLVCGYAQASDQVVHSVKGKFSDVKENVEMAITDRGLVINNVSYIGNMLDRTGKAVGDTKKIYLKAETFEFCSAVYSRGMMEADPKNIVYCPYTIAVYVLPREPKKVYIAYRRPPIEGSAKSKAALKKVDKLMADIVKHAMSMY